MPKDPKAKNRRGEMETKLGERDVENLEIINNEEERERKGERGFKLTKDWRPFTSLSPWPITLSACLISHEEDCIAHQMPANIQTTQIIPASPVWCIFHFCVCVCVCIGLWVECFLHQPLVSHRELLRWAQCLPGFCSVRDTKASRTF